METITMYHDIRVFYVRTPAAYLSIPDAYQELIKTIPFAKDRMYYGIISYENGCGRYRLAVEQLTQHEGRELNLELHVIKRGVYLSSIVRNYLQDITEIERTFERLLSQTGQYDHQNRVEWYFNGKDVACMVRLKKE
jgi:hypothetical protein